MGKKGVAQCVGSFCVHALLFSLCMSCVADKNGWEGHTERRQGRERKEECFGRKEKKKSSHSKSPNTQIKKQLFSPFSSFLFDFSPFFSFSRFKNNKTLKSTQMTDKKDMKAQSVNELEVLVAQGDMDAKRELAIRLIEGNGVPQNHPIAVALLEDCVALGDAEAMLMLAKCCALGHGMEQDVERAESLISEAAKNGNYEALCLMKHMDNCQGEKMINLMGLFCPTEERFGIVHSVAHHRANKG